MIPHISIIRQMAPHNAYTATRALQRRLQRTCLHAPHHYDENTEVCIWCLQPRSEIENKEKKHG